VSLWSRSEKVPVSTVSTVSITTIRLDNYDITDDQEGMYPFVSESPLLTVYGLSLGRQNNAHVEILIARSLILISKKATRPYIYGTSTYVLI